MILKDDFYTVTHLAEENNTILVTLELNAGHSIFKGHFPGQPVVPGVCMIQMVKELLETALGKSLQLREADHIKFLSVIDPRQCVDIDASLLYTCSGQEYEVTASLFKGDTVYLKLKGNFRISGTL